MPSEPITYAGLNLSSGRKPVTFAALDDDLNIVSLQKWDLDLLQLKEYENVYLGINVPSRENETFKEMRRKVVQAGFKPFSNRNDPKQFFETDPQACFQALIGHTTFPRRALEGRLQRCAILYEQGLQIVDPVDLFEEITRYKLIQGILPLEKLPSPKELDALVAAYLAWMCVKRPGQTASKGEFLLPAQE